MIENDRNFIIFGAPDIKDDEINEIITSLRSGWIGTGPKVSVFENNFKAYKQAKYAAAVNSCTAALHLALIAAGVGLGDEVITTPLTFCATVNAIIHSGATPVLADIDPITMNMDPKQVIRKINHRTKAMIPVHFAGRACDMDALMDIASSRKLKMIEDCAHALETEYKGRKAGTFGDFGCFSFYVTKSVVTGEGGMVLAKEQKDIEKIQILGLHGMSKHAWKRFLDEGYKHYQVIEAGFKYNMTDLQASLGIHQLGRVEMNWLRRQEIWQQYNTALSGLPVTLPAAIEPDTRHAYHLYTILIDQDTAGITRDQFISAMTRENIGVGVHYVSIPEHPYYQAAFGWEPDDYPYAKSIGRQTVSLPLSSKLTNHEVNRIIAAVCNALRGNVREEEST